MSYVESLQEVIAFLETKAENTMKTPEERSMYYRTADEVNEINNQIMRGNNPQDVIDLVWHVDELIGGERDFDENDRYEVPLSGTYDAGTFLIGRMISNALVIWDTLNAGKGYEIDCPEVRDYHLDYLKNLWQYLIVDFSERVRG